VAVAIKSQILCFLVEGWKWQCSKCCYMKKQLEPFHIHPSWYLLWKAFSHH